MLIPNFDKNLDEGYFIDTLCRSANPDFVGSIDHYGSRSIQISLLPRTDNVHFDQYRSPRFNKARLRTFYNEHKIRRAHSTHFEQEKTGRQPVPPDNTASVFVMNE